MADKKEQKELELPRFHSLQAVPRVVFEKKNGMLPHFNLRNVLSGAIPSFCGIIGICFAIFDSENFLKHVAQPNLTIAWSYQLIIPALKALGIDLMDFGQEERNGTKRQILVMDNELIFASVLYKKDWLPKIVFPRGRENVLVELSEQAQDSLWKLMKQQQISGYQVPVVLSYAVANNHVIWSYCQPASLLNLIGIGVPDILEPTTQLSVANWNPYQAPKIAGTGNSSSYPVETASHLGAFSWKTAYFAWLGRTIYPEGMDQADQKFRKMMLSENYLDFFLANVCEWTKGVPDKSLRIMLFYRLLGTWTFKGQVGKINSFFGKFVYWLLLTRQVRFDFTLSRFLTFSPIVSTVHSHLRRAVRVSIDNEVKFVFECCGEFLDPKQIATSCNSCPIQSTGKSRLTHSGFIETRKTKSVSQLRWTCCRGTLKSDGCCWVSGTPTHFANMIRCPLDRSILRTFKCTQFIPCQKRKLRKVETVEGINVQTYDCCGSYYLLCSVCRFQCRIYDLIPHNSPKLFALGPAIGYFYDYELKKPNKILLETFQKQDPTTKSKKDD